jgi:hypothetical protein
MHASMESMAGCADRIIYTAKKWEEPPSGRGVWDAKKNSLDSRGWFPEKSEKGGIFGGHQSHPSHCLLMGKAMALGSLSPYFRKAPLPRERLSPATQQRQLWLCPCHGCRTGIGEVLKSIFVAATCGYPCLSGSHFITFLLVDEKMVPFAAIG